MRRVEIPKCASQSWNGRDIMQGHNSQQLRSIIERVEAVESEIKELAEGRKEIFQEAGGDRVNSGDAELPGKWVQMGVRDPVFPASWQGHDEGVFLLVAGVFGDDGVPGSPGVEIEGSEIDPAVGRSFNTLIPAGIIDVLSLAIADMEPGGH